MTTHVAVVGLGSNVGSREAFLREGMRLLDGLDGVTVEARSPLYATAAVGPPQPDFLNAAVRVRIERDAEILLAQALDVERRLGRVRTVRWGPRTVDLDLLWWSGAAVDTSSLTVPHPRLTERAFALAPLLDVAPELADVYGDALARAGGRPAAREWARVERTDAEVVVEAADAADALAIASGMWAEGVDLDPVEVASPEGFVAAGGRVIRSWESGVIRGLGGSGRRAREVVVEGGRCVVRG